DAAPQPVGPYAISKLKGEGEVQQGGARGLETAILRLGTVFGSAPMMRFDGVASRFVYFVGVGRPMIVHGNGEQVRPLIHVQDASAALRLALVAPGAEGQILNAVTMNHSVNELAAAMQRLVPGAEVRYTDQDVLNRISFAVDGSRLRALGFASEYDLEAGLREMLARWRGIRPALGALPRLDRSDFGDL
ncbi:MAG: NAD-dependent epimerase/dehydratase family protein, partial [Anaerolineae bacterium]|nr:NAD-dependent epimerase/dehydratase family protein [Anaerolineae bacterium]